MARPVRGCPTARSQQEGTEEPDRDPQQEDQPDATGGKDIEDYNPDVDYEEWEPKVEQSGPEQREVESFFSDIKSPSQVTEIIQPLVERETTPDKAL